MLNRSRIRLVLLIWSNCMCAIVSELLVRAIHAVVNTTCLLLHSKFLLSHQFHVWWITEPIINYNIGHFLFIKACLILGALSLHGHFVVFLIRLTQMSMALSILFGYGMHEVVSIIFFNSHNCFCWNLSIII